MAYLVATWEYGIAQATPFAKIGSPIRYPEYWVAVRVGIQTLEHAIPGAYARDTWPSTWAVQVRPSTPIAPVIPTDPTTFCFLRPGCVLYPEHGYSPSMSP